MQHRLLARPACPVPQVVGPPNLKLQTLQGSVEAKSLASFQASGQDDWFSFAFAAQQSTGAGPCCAPRYQCAGVLTKHISLRLESRCDTTLHATRTNRKKQRSCCRPIRIVCLCRAARLYMSSCSDKSQAKAGTPKAIVRRIDTEFIDLDFGFSRHKPPGRPDNKSTFDDGKKVRRGNDERRWRCAL